MFEAGIDRYAYQWGAFSFNASGRSLTIFSSENDRTRLLLAAENQILATVRISDDNGLSMGRVHRSHWNATSIPAELLNRVSAIIRFPVNTSGSITLLGNGREIIGPFTVVRQRGEGLVMTLPEQFSPARQVHHDAQRASFRRSNDSAHERNRPVTDQNNQLQQNIINVQVNNVLVNNVQVNLYPEAKPPSEMLVDFRRDFADMIRQQLTRTGPNHLVIEGELQELLERIRQQEVLLGLPVHQCTNFESVRQQMEGEIQAERSLEQTRGMLRELEPNVQRVVELDSDDNDDTDNETGRLVINVLEADYEADEEEDEVVCTTKEPEIVDLTGDRGNVHISFDL